jgi:hypothetical protein
MHDGGKFSTRSPRLNQVLRPVDRCERVLFLLRDGVSDKAVLCLMSTGAAATGVREMQRIED